MQETWIIARPRSINDPRELKTLEAIRMEHRKAMTITGTKVPNSNLCIIRNSQYLKKNQLNKDESANAQASELL